jgi:hypothetical protein
MTCWRFPGLFRAGKFQFRICGPANGGSDEAVKVPQGANRDRAQSGCAGGHSKGWHPLISPAVFIARLIAKIQRRAG